MKKIFLLLLYLCLGISSPASAKPDVPILVYHSIAEFTGHGLKGLYVTPENFEKQMTYLKNHDFTLLTFDNWEDRQKVDKPIFITFDDGYKDNLNILPIFQKLKDHHFSPMATIFVISDFVGRRNRLTAVEIKRLNQSGYFSIQSHTATHPELIKIKNYRYELKHSKEKIEQITGRPVFALSYPYGLYNQVVLEETKKYYQYGLTDHPVPNSEIEPENKNYLLPRNYIYYSTTLEEFARLVHQNR